MRSRRGRKNLKLLSDAGVTIALGTDSGTDEGRWQGYFEQVELEMMAKAGMTPMQVIVAATSAAAQRVGARSRGTIAPGKAADLLVLDANPLQDILNTRKIHSVWIGGHRMGATGTNCQRLEYCIGSQCRRSSRSPRTSHAST